MVKKDIKVDGEAFFKALSGGSRSGTTGEDSRVLRSFMRLSSYSWGIVGASAFAAAVLWNLKGRLDTKIESGKPVKKGKDD